MSLYKEPFDLAFVVLPVVLRINIFVERLDNSQRDKV
jgi:hypothetical protein